jgi:hypothetical protein
MPMRRRQAPIMPIMRHYCQLIAAELLSWPDVSSRRMFGLTLFYRAGFKLRRISESDRERLLADEHVDLREDAKWITFALREDGDIRLFLR